MLQETTDYLSEELQITNNLGERYNDSQEREQCSHDLKGEVWKEHPSSECPCKGGGKRYGGIDMGARELAEQHDDAGDDAAESEGDECRFEPKVRYGSPALHFEYHSQWPCHSSDFSYYPL